MQTPAAPPKPQSPHAELPQCALATQHRSYTSFHAHPPRCTLSSHQVCQHGYNIHEVSCIMNMQSLQLQGKSGCNCNMVCALSDEQWHQDTAFSQTWTSYMLGWMQVITTAPIDDHPWPQASDSLRTYNQTTYKLSGSCLTNLLPQCRAFCLRLAAVHRVSCTNVSVFDGGVR